MPPVPQEDRSADQGELSDKIDRLTRRVDDLIEQTSRVQGAASFEFRDGAINLRAVVVVGTLAFGALGFGVGTEVGEGDPNDVLDLLDLLEERDAAVGPTIAPGAPAPLAMDCDAHVRSVGAVAGFTIVGRLASGLEVERYEAERAPASGDGSLPSRLIVNCMQMGAGAPTVWLEEFDEAN
jgi:hypothetical protein